MDRTRRQVTRTLLIGAAAAPLAGVSLVACSKGDRGSRSAAGASEAVPGPRSSRFARILVDDVTALVNVNVLKDNGGAGVAIGMKDWYGVIHNPQRCHDDGCNPFIPHLAAFPLIHDKLRLTIVDGLTAQCHGGPTYSPRWSWPYGGLLVSTDPVALDAVGRSVLEERRSEVGLPSLAAEGRAPKWIAEGARIGLGEADLARIAIEDV